jgi:hypothetical protein
MRFRFGRRFMWSVAMTVALAAAVGGVAYATIPDPAGTIHGCYARSGGSLRVIDDSVTNCKSTETSLDWNVQGPQPHGAGRASRRSRTARATGICWPPGPIRAEPRLLGHGREWRPHRQDADQGSIAQPASRDLRRLGGDQRQ